MKTKRQIRATKRIDTILENIAQKELSIPTLQERKMDDLDFHEISVWGLKQALLAAFEAGRNDTK